ncbi:MAG: YncE family protein [Mycobacterium sp.]
MTNSLVPTGHVMLDDSSASSAAGAAPVEAVDGDAILECCIPVGRGPIGDIAVGGADVETLVVANVVDQSAAVIADPAAQLRGDNVAVAGEPVAVVAAGDHAYVATGSAGQDAVSAIDLESRTVVANFPLAFGVTALAASPDGKRVYAGRTAYDRVDVTVIDTVARRAGTIEIGAGPAAGIDALCVDPNGKRLYAAVTDETGGRLVVVDCETSRVQRVVMVGSPIRDIAYAGGMVYVLTSDRAVGGAVHVVDLSANRVTDTVNIGGAPTQLVMSPDHARAYVVDYDRVVVLCTVGLEIVDSLSVDARPSCVALGSDGSRLYVADYSGTVHVFSVAATMEMLYSQFLAIDPIALNQSPALESVTA